MNETNVNRHLGDLEKINTRNRCALKVNRHLGDLEILPAAPLVVGTVNRHLGDLEIGLLCCYRL